MILKLEKKPGVTGLLFSLYSFIDLKYGILCTICCDTAFTIEHILLDCVDFADPRSLWKYVQKAAQWAMLELQ